MPRTRNGFPVLSPDSQLLTTVKIEGVPFRLGVPYLPVIKHLAGFLHALEPVGEIGWDGGYANRMVRGSADTWSEHAAGSAIDWNASQHPLGAARDAGWSVTQVRAIRWYLSGSLGQLWRWGNDFSRPDPMHFELRDYDAWRAWDDAR